MPKPVQVAVESSAQAVITQMTPAQRVQFFCLVEALRLSPRAGVFYARDLQNRTLYQVSAADVHVIYTIVYRVWSDYIFIVAIEIAEWSREHADTP